MRKYIIIIVILIFSNSYSQGNISIYQLKNELMDKDIFFKRKDVIEMANSFFIKLKSSDNIVIYIPIDNEFVKSSKFNQSYSSGGVFLIYDEVNNVYIEVTSYSGISVENLGHKKFKINIDINEKYISDSIIWINDNNDKLMFVITQF